MIDWTARVDERLSLASKLAITRNVKVPSLPRAVLQFARKADQPDVNNTELASIVETDDGMTCTLLKRVNSSATGLRHKIASTQHAIQMLGIRNCKLVLMTQAIENTMNPGESRLIDMYQFWNSKLERALFAREVARLLSAHTEMAFTGGILQDFLLPWLANRKQEMYLRFMKEQAEHPIEITEFEQSWLGYDHATEAARLLHKWRFPEELVCCVLLHHGGVDILSDPELGRTSVAATCISALLPGPFQQAPGGFESLIRLDVGWPEFDLNAIATAVDSQFMELSPDAHDHLPLAERVNELRQSLPPEFYIEAKAAEAPAAPSDTDTVELPIPSA